MPSAVGGTNKSSSSTRGDLDDFAGSVTDFLRLFVSTLSVARVTKFLALVLEAIRARSVGSIGALCAILAAFDVGAVGSKGTTTTATTTKVVQQVPAMGRDVLFQLKETLLVVLPPLNQVRSHESRYCK